eukprot:Plantae.Rhodophyta-Hildenbrandia_rubra.ctg11453.p1 GENE.Plantae.Rhodophyta-Hildenbrandia_rubra.ctg11453~~Plantae.Rhodophyta-Hildenbrandia_rubra.ctg11453.p1  ORF type:complete len:560 (+),score=99.52 Plantae.Rhodophyta-Hildenbrandia_rubra.ctg11453:194-1873(+)
MDLGFVSPSPLHSGESVFSRCTLLRKRQLLSIPLSRLPAATLSPPTAHSQRTPSPAQSTPATNPFHPPTPSGLPPYDQYSSPKTPTTKDSAHRFFDVARIYTCGGRGGRGCLAFRREKCTPRGGPSGGNGGHGGDVILRATSSQNTLTKVHRNVHYRGGNGTNGMGKGKNGAIGSKVVINVPVGTIIRADGDEGIVVADLSEEGDVYVAAKGGRAGRGNLAFKTDRNTAPRIAEEGEPGQSRWWRLELKLIADVALIGRPNAGKSSMLRALSNARPKVADYPFTTITPVLGKVPFAFNKRVGSSGNVFNGDDGDELVIVDIPGLIAGAHSGAGMGSVFLRHIERSKILVNIIDGSDDDPVENFLMVNRELFMFHPHLYQKEQVIVVNKLDLPHVREKWESGELKDKVARAVERAFGHRRIIAVSALSSEGVETFVSRLRGVVDNVSKQEKENGGFAVRVEKMTRGEAVTVEQTKKVGDGPSEWAIGGWRVEQLFRMTNWDYMESMDRFQRVLKAIGVDKRLEEMGAVEDDLVRVGDREFSFSSASNVFSAAAIASGFED